MTRPMEKLARLAALLAAVCVAAGCASLRLAPQDDRWQSWDNGAATIAAGLSVRTRLVPETDPPSLVVEVWNLGEEPASVSVTGPAAAGTIGCVRNAEGRPPLVAGESLSIAHSPPAEGPWYLYGTGRDHPTAGYGLTLTIDLAAPGEPLVNREIDWTLRIDRGGEPAELPLRFRVVERSAVTNAAILTFGLALVTLEAALYFAVLAL